MQVSTAISNGAIPANAKQRGKDLYSAMAAETGEDDRQVIWTAQAGSQVSYISCPYYEVLYHGPRGNGKTDAFLMSYAQYVGRGFGASWRGIIFRRTYPELADIVAKSMKWFPRIWPDAKFNHQRYSWEWPDGEALLLRHMKVPEDYLSYHGHEYPFMGWEELTNWPDDICYRKMMTCCRTSTPGVPLMVRATTNPYGPGHNWIKKRFRLANRWRETIVIRDEVDSDGDPVEPRAAIHGSLSENKRLLEADPGYAKRVSDAATNASMLAAWKNGDWDVVAGGMFDDVWSDSNCLPDFVIPRTWRISRGFDWGSSKPFSVGWYAISDGSDLTLSSGYTMATVPGDIFRIREWYGCEPDKTNEGLRMLARDVTRGIIEREIGWGWRPRPEVDIVVPGPADAAIYGEENGMSIARDMLEPCRIDGNQYDGIHWTAADKKSGSRVSGWENMRNRIANANPVEPGLPRENPGFFVIGCRNPEFLRTVLTLPRDEKRPDDVDTEAEDHIADEVRYFLRAQGQVIRSGTTVGTNY